jgi:FtsX-like permease family
VAAIRPDLAQGSPAAMLRRLAPRGALAGAPLPGRPARLLITARLSGAVGTSLLSVTMADGFGISYQAQAGPLLADGRPHTLTVLVAPRPGTAYPLRITGFSLQYQMPKQNDVPAQLMVSALRAAPRTGPAGPAASLGPQGARYKSFGSVSPPGQFGLLRKQPVVTPAFIGHAGLTLDFTSGSGYGPPIRSCGQFPNRHPCGPPGSLPTIVAMTYAMPGAVVPVAVTHSFASATGLHAGQTFPVIFQGTNVSVRVVSIVSGFPTLTGPTGGVIADQGLLQQALGATGTGPAGVTEWWLRTGGPVTLPGLPPGTTVTSRAAVASALLANPLGAAPQLAMLAIAAAAVILAAGGFLVAAATAGERAHDMALLAALGATRRQLTRLLCLEQALVAIPAAAAGLLLGGLLARLVIPAVTITATGRHPQPPALIQVPVAVPAAVAVIVAAVPVLIAAAGGGPRARVSVHTRAEAST